MHPSSAEGEVARRDVAESSLACRPLLLHDPREPSRDGRSRRACRAEKTRPLSACQRSHHEAVLEPQDLGDSARDPRAARVGVEDDTLLDRTLGKRDTHLSHRDARRVVRMRLGSSITSTSPRSLRSEPTIRSRVDQGRACERRPRVVARMSPQTPNVATGVEHLAPGSDDRTNRYTCWSPARHQEASCVGLFLSLRAPLRPFSSHPRHELPIVTRTSSSSVARARARS